MMRTLHRVSTLLLAASWAASLSLSAQEGDDPFLWLEEVESPRSLEWVEARNAETVQELSREPTYDGLYEDALEILSSEDRIAYPSIMGDALYNFWTDRDHERGIWRRTSWEAYLGGSPSWETVLDIDAIAEEEGVPWAFGGASCLAPDYERCLVRLSRGGSDAVEIREFDLEGARFIEDGFRIPEAKTSTAWVDENTLLVATDWGEGSLTSSGYPRIAKLWTRGSELGSGTTLLEVPEDHVALFLGSLETDERSYQVVFHRPTFFEGVVYVLEGEDLVAIDVPMDASPSLMGDQLVVFVRTPWEVGGRTFPTGSVIATDLERFMAGARDFSVVVESAGRSAVQGVAPIKDYLLVSVLDNVRGELWKYRLEGGEWVGEKVPAPDFGTVGIGSTDPHTNRFFFTYSSFLQPTTLFLSEEGGGVREVRSLPAQFDADGLTVEQHEARSRDGTMIPYFVVHDEDLQLDGTNPTQLYAYGGFEIPMTAGYSSLVGKAWLERGGVYVQANIRGGGEFGPDWHRAGLKENRQRVYDDFIAVAEDLIARGVTSPEHLGIRGGSNGGLLVGVAMTQRPDLFDAVVVQVPLLDMKRYNKLLAGASWMAEYGNPDLPEEWAYISQYSPYQNVREDEDYPRPLFTTTTRDDRVHPGHARKMAAKMRGQGHPIYYFENTEGGHGSGVTPEQQARMYAITYAYLWKHLGDRTPVS